jgi:phosphatidylserine decarboxylase
MTTGRGLPWYVRVLPRRAVSRGVGALTRIPLPPLVLAPILWAYARAFGADLEEAERPLRGYASFLDFFTRRLRRDARPLPDDERALVSPSDGRVHATGTVSRGLVLQAKGVHYALADLLGAEADAAALEGGTYVVIHLAPGDYHRFHWPADGTVEQALHVAGDLWPVHPRALGAAPGLLAANERVVLIARGREGAAFTLVAVGALNVGSIRIPGVPLRTNRGGGGRRRVAGLALAGRRGEELGRFEMGSCLVLLLASSAGRLDDLAPGTRLEAGQAIGRLTGAAGPGGYRTTMTGRR